MQPKPKCEPCDPIAEIIASSLCDVCLDSGLTLSRGEIIRCPLCFAEGESFSLPAVRLTLSVWEKRDQGRIIDPALFVLARLLTRTTSVYPLMLEDLRLHLRLSDKRKVKEMARTLRREWLLPIGSSRQPPYGYYWCLTERDFLDWERTYRSQAVDELATLCRLRRRNYPELAGQTSLFVEQISAELMEVLS